MVDKSDLRRLCSDIENCGGIAQLMRGGLLSKWVELVNPTAVISLLDQCDAALAELEALRIQVGTLTEWYSNALDVISEVSAAIPGVTYMDPPDGGDVSIPAQIRRIAKDAELYRWVSSGVQEAETLVSVVLCRGGDSRKVAERIAVYMEANQEALNA